MDFAFIYMFTQQAGHSSTKNVGKERAGNFISIIWNEDVCFIQKPKNAYKKALEVNNTEVDWYQIGLDHLDESDYKKALEAFNKCVSLDSNNADAWYQIGLVHFDKGEYETSLKAFKKCVSLDPKNEDACNQIGKFHTYTEALKEFDKALEINNKDARWWYQTGLVLFDTGDYKKALEAFKKCVSLDSNNADAWYQIGLVHFDEGEYEKYLKAFNECKRLDSNKADAWYQIGLVHLDKNDYKKALDAFNECKRLDSKKADAWYQIGLVHLDKNDYKKALDAFNECKCLDSNNADALYQIGLVYFDEGEYEKSLEAFDECKDHIDGLVKKGRINLYLNHFNEAIKSFDDALQKDKEKLSAINYKAYTFELTSELNLAKKFYDQALFKCNENIEKIKNEQKSVDKILLKRDEKIKKEQKFFEAWYQKGFCLLYLKEYDKALNAFEKAIELKSRNSDAWNNKGNALYFLEKYEDAIDAYKEAYRLKPRTTYQSNIGCSLSKQGKYEEAIEYYDEALKTNPAFVDALSNKGFDLYNLKKYKEALDAIDKVIELNPSLAEAWNNKALVYRELLKFDEALKFCKKAFMLNPTGDICFNTGLILNELDFYEEGKKYLKQALSIFEDSIIKNPNSFETWYKKGLVLFNLYRYEESILAFNKAIEKNNKNELVYIVHIHKGNAYYSLTKYTEAIESYCESIKLLIKETSEKENKIGESLDCALIDRENNSQEYKEVIETYIKKIKSLKKEPEIEDKLDRAFIGLGNVYLAQEKYIKAIYFYEKAKDVNKNSVDAWNNIGLAYYNIAIAKKAEEVFNKALEKNPKKPVSCYNRVTELIGTINNKDGKKDLETALRITPKYISANLKKAEEAFNKALEINPKNSMAYNNRALVFIETNNYKDGKKDLKTALRINPKCISANFNLAKFLVHFGNFKNSYECIKKVTKQELSNDPKKADAWSLQGQIEIELLQYDDAIDSFNEAIYQGGDDYLFLLWIAYAKYLKVEFILEKNPVKQKELLHSIIKDLDKALCIPGKENATEYEIENKIGINCILGCIYYKSGDYHTSKVKLLECIDLCEEYEDQNKTKNSNNANESVRLRIDKNKKLATELVLQIWNHNIKPIWWVWWLDYPVESKNKLSYKQSFKLFVALLFILLFFHPIYPVLFGRLSGLIQYNNFFSVNWYLYIILVALLIVIMLYPSLNKIKIEGVEFEINSPPPLKFYYSPAIDDQVRELIGSLKK